MSINPREIKPSISFRIPDITTDSFSPNKLSTVEPDIFNPSTLDQVATGFAQDMQGVSFFLEPNVIINNAKRVGRKRGDRREKRKERRKQR